MKISIRRMFSSIKQIFQPTIVMRDEPASNPITNPFTPEQMDTLQFLVRTVEERSRTLESLIHIVEERTGTLELLMRSNEQRLLLLEQRSDKDGARFQELERLGSTIEERSRTLEFMLVAIEKQSQSTQHLVQTIEQRSNTIEYVSRQNLFSLTHIQEQLQKFYVEAIPELINLQGRPAFNALNVMQLETLYPIAVDSNDHISPDSTTEGVSRPTLFVQDCIRVLGAEMKCLDLGTGGAGLVYEFAKNQVLAVGIDGSDFCRVNKIGYWPLLPNNLFTCDITKNFRFLSRESNKQLKFELITSWEVLEHIAEDDLPELFENITAHLGSDGYFIGSISRVEYHDKDGVPYHVTLQSREWWKQKFAESNLMMLEKHPFHENFFCRGNGPRFQDYHNYSQHPEDGFLFVAKALIED